MNLKWKPGCMVGCGLLLLVAVAVVGSGTWYGYRMTRDFKGVKASEDELIAVTTPAVEAIPGNLGFPTPERVQAFLRVRESLGEWRTQLEDAVMGFQRAQDQQQNRALRFLKTLQAGTDLAPVYAGYWQRRNTLLLEQAMGPGEYAYLYRILYFGWLGHDPADGVMTPAGTALVSGENPGGGQTRVRTAEELSGRARSNATDKTRLALEKVAWPATVGDPDLEAWVASIRLWMQEGDQIQGFGARGAPAVFQEVLGAYRDRLEHTYNATLNPVTAMFSADAPGED